MNDRGAGRLFVLSPDEHTPETMRYVRIQGMLHVYPYFHRE